MNQLKLSRVPAYLTALLCGGLACQAATTTIYVGTCGTPNQPTIQKAVTASSAGGTVRICPGTYAEQVTIGKNLTLIGVASGNANSAVITPPVGGVQVNATDAYPSSPSPVAAQVLVQNASSVNISNITVDGANNGISGCSPDLRGIYYLNASGTVSGVVTRNQALTTSLNGCQSGQGIFVQSGYSSGTAVVTVQNSSIHNFQKNGISVDGPGAKGTIVNNRVQGQGPTTGAAENGIQISDGAAASVSGNVVLDEIWAPDKSTDTGDAASGILVYGSQNVAIQNNVVGTTQFGIVTVTAGAPGTSNNPQGLGDRTVISGNQILNTQLFDAIDLCSNSNTVSGNTIFNATESGIHLDDSCGTTAAPTGGKNTVTGNVVTEACASILTGTGTKSNTIAGNAAIDVTNVTLGGDVCPAAGTAASANATTLLQLIGGSGKGSAHPSPVL